MDDELLQEDDEYTLDVLYGMAPAPKHPEREAKKAEHAKKSRDFVYDRAYELRRQSDPVLRQRWETRQETNHLIRAGRIVKTECEVCGEPKTDAHHTDYSDPYAIMWLCRKCHNRHEGSVRKKQRKQRNG